MIRTTIDQHTRRSFKWETTYQVRLGEKYITVPARTGKRRMTYLHPDRVDPVLLEALNAEGAGRRCGECLVDLVIVVKLGADGKCPACGANYAPEVAV